MCKIPSFDYHDNVRYILAPTGTVTSQGGRHLYFHSTIEFLKLELVKRANFNRLFPKDTIFDVTHFNIFLDFYTGKLQRPQAFQKCIILWVYD